MSDDEMSVRTFPMPDTGLGREAGYASDAELFAAAEKERAKAMALVTPEAWDRLEAAEDEMARKILGL